MSRKTVSFGQLLNYINAPKEKGRFAILHNLRAAVDYPQQIEAEFLENYNHIRGGRKDGVVLYHEVIAIAKEDRQHVTEEMLNDLAREYLRRRAPNALAYAKAQFDTDSPHVHLMISGNLIESKKKLHLDRAEFEQVKRELEAYQRERYPMLTYSIVYGSHRTKHHNKPQLTNPEAGRVRRLRDRAQQQPTRKEEARERLKACLTDAQSEEHLVELLNAAQLVPYVRGKTPGVTDTRTGRKYRLNTLGLDREGQETIRRLRANQPQQERTQARLQKVEDIKLAKVQRQWLRLGFREDIAQTLQGDPAGRREREITQTKQAQRRRSRTSSLDNRFPTVEREKAGSEGPGE